MPVEAKPLFRPDVLRPHLLSFQWPTNVTKSKATLARWAEMVSTGRADKFKEQEMLPDFLSDVFCEVLEYSRPADNPERHTISREKLVEVDGKFADAVLGDFRQEHEDSSLPWKARDRSTRSTALCRAAHVRRGSGLSLRHQSALRLDHRHLDPPDAALFKGADQQTYERFDTEKLASDETLLKKFVYSCWGQSGCVPVAGRCHLLRPADEPRKKSAAN